MISSDYPLKLLGVSLCVNSEVFPTGIFPNFLQPTLNLRIL